MTTLSSPTIDIELAHIVAVRLASMQDDGCLPKPISQDVRSKLQKRLPVLRLALAAAKPIEIQQEIAKLMAGYASVRSNQAEAAAMLSQFVVALEGVPLWALRAACRDILRGSILGLNPDFPPTAPRVRQLVDQRDAPLHEEKRDIERLLSAPVAPEGIGQSPHIAAGLRNMRDLMVEKDKEFAKIGLKPSTFKPPTWDECAEIYKSRPVPPASDRNVTRNVERNVTADDDIEIIEGAGLSAFEQRVGPS